MRYYDELDDYENYNMGYDPKCIRRCSECKCKNPCCDKGICINNNPIIKICMDDHENGTELPTPFLSDYMEVLGKGQTIPEGGNIVFDADSSDSVGNSIELNASGTTFTINRTGLYHIEWNLDLARNTTAAVVGIIENGQPASGSATVVGGNFSSGTLINVTTVPFTLSLCNYNNEIIIEDIAPYEDSAASIRIVRFADGPNE